MSEQLADAIINEWANSSTKAEQVAATLARELRGAPRWHPVDSGRDIGARLDVSSTTASKAKRLLADHGVIMKDNGSTTLRDWPPGHGAWEDTGMFATRKGNAS